MAKPGRKNDLIRLVSALWPLRVPAWPHRGPVGIRERSDIHIVDQWQFLGTVRCESDIHGVLETRPGGFDPRVRRLLTRALSRLPPNRIIDLADYGRLSMRANPSKSWVGPAGFEPATKGL